MLELIKGVGGMSHKVVSLCTSCVDEAFAAHSLSVAGVAAAGSVIVVRMPSLSAHPFAVRV